MLTDKEIFDAVNDAPLGRCGATTVVSVGRAIEAKVLAKLRAEGGEIGSILDDADDWMRFVVEDFAPTPLRTYLENAMAQRAAARKAAA